MRYKKLISTSTNLFSKVTGTHEAQTWIICREKLGLNLAEMANIGQFATNDDQAGRWKEEE